MRRLVSRLRIVASALALLLGASCEAGAGDGCLTRYDPGILLEIRDSTTLASVPAAIATATEGTFLDTLRHIPEADSAFQRGVYQRPGAYAVTVTHPDYQVWVRDSVVVKPLGCDVETVRITVLLQP